MLPLDVMTRNGLGHKRRAIRASQLDHVLIGRRLSIEIDNYLVELVRTDLDRCRRLSVDENLNLMRSLLIACCQRRDERVEHIDGCLCGIPDSVAIFISDEK